MELRGTNVGQRRGPGRRRREPLEIANSAGVDEKGTCRWGGGWRVARNLPQGLKSPGSPLRQSSVPPSSQGLAGAGK